MFESSSKTKPRVTGKDESLTEDEFKKRFRLKFHDPHFKKMNQHIEELAHIAWENYHQHRKAPLTQKAGDGFADPDYELSLDWIQARDAIREAQAEQEDASGPNRILLISGADRNDQSCPGEISKTIRLARMAQEVFQECPHTEVELLDLSRITSEYGKMIYPCKACVSTAMPLCHWPCSCYPNHSLGQVNDWMNEIYPQWVRAHGIMIITPVYWHQAPSVLKLMIDRLVCSDGGNPDPTSTQGKKAELAKKIELSGWDYPRHLKGRTFSVVVHGDAVGVDHLKSALTDWLEEMELLPVSTYGTLGRYIGYYEPYATSHQSLDKDMDVQEEVRNAARALYTAVASSRAHHLDALNPSLKEPRPK